MGELKSAAQRLVRNPAFSLMIALLLAAGIGASAVIFGAWDALSFRPLAVRNPQELVRLVQHVPRLGTISAFDPEYHRALREHASSFSAVIGNADWPVTLNRPAPAELVRVQFVTPEFFDELGAAPLIGRTLRRDDNSSSDPDAVLSYGFWRRRFHGDPAVAAQTLSLHGHAFVVAGVMPRRFNGLETDTAPDLWVPVRTFPRIDSYTSDRSTSIYLQLAARLKPGIGIEQARAESLALFRSTLERLAKTPEDRRELERELERGVDLEPLEHGVSMLRDRFLPGLRLVAACIAMLLLMMCSNVAGLLLARGAARQEEIAVRLALGATRGRLIRQALAESALLSALGAALGLLFAAAGSPLLARALPPMRDRGTTLLPLALDLSPDWRVLRFALAAGALAAILFGLPPALASARQSLDAILRGARASGHWRGRSVLVVIQVAVCTLLLACAGLLLRSFEQLRSVKSGFDHEHLVSFSVDPSLSGYTAPQTARLRQTLRNRTAELPGVVSAATAARGLMRGSGIKITIGARGERVTSSDFLNSSLLAVSPEYFDTMRMRVLSGRSFDAADSRAPKAVRALVNETFARKFFPGVNPVGRFFGPANESQIATAAYEIIGVVNDAKYRSLREPMQPVVYTSTESGGFVLYARTTGSPETLIQPVRSILTELDASLPFIEIHTMTREVEASAASERLTASLAAAIGALAALLATAGIYGLLAFAVLQRRREIGIRMALGAAPSRIAALIARQSLLMVLPGILLGIAAALATGRWIRTLLYEVPPSDPVSLSVAALLVLLVAVLGTAAPLARATRVEPAIALRAERA